jgi:hypothetical protein
MLIANKIHVKEMTGLEGNVANCVGGGSVRDGGRSGRA